MTGIVRSALKIPDAPRVSPTFVLSPNLLGMMTSCFHMLTSPERIVQMASSVAGPMLQDATAGGSDSAGMDALGKAFGAVGGALSKHMPPDEFLAFAKKLTSADYVRAEGGPIDFESEFCGDDMVRLYPLLAFILEVNYAQFFRGLGLSKAVTFGGSSLGRRREELISTAVSALNDCFY